MNTHVPVLVDNSRTAGQCPPEIWTLDNSLRLELNPFLTL